MKNRESDRRRQAARKAKDFARADEIRGLLLDKGIELKDTREGVKETNLMQLKELFYLEDQDLRSYSPLTLAYIGMEFMNWSSGQFLLRKATAR